MLIQLFCGVCVCVDEETQTKIQRKKKLITRQKQKRNRKNCCLCLHTHSCWWCLFIVLWASFLAVYWCNISETNLWFEESEWEKERARTREIERDYFEQLFRKTQKAWLQKLLNKSDHYDFFIRDPLPSYHCTDPHPVWFRSLPDEYARHGKTWHKTSWSSNINNMHIVEHEATTAGNVEKERCWKIM